MIMKTFCKDKTDVAQFVDDILHNLNKDSAWTMTIKHGKSEDYFALIAIEGLSEDTARTMGWTFLDELYSISKENTQVG